jgi:thioesterase domain-containing protein/acyl carrier protein
MLPSGIVTVAEIPTTINGKLDTAALPEWSPSRPAGEAGPTVGVGDIPDLVYQIVADVTGWAGLIRPSDDLIDDLGGSSLDLVRLLAEFERSSGQRLRISEALADTTVAGLVRLARGEAASSSSPTDFSFNPAGAAPPLFMIHTYLGGMLGYRRMAELLPAEQPAYGLHVYRGTGDVGSELTISALAREAVDRIRQVAPTGRITMIGHSAGGLIVLEAARQVVEVGGLKPRILLMDTPRPYGALGYYWGESLLYWRQIARHPARSLKGALARTIRLVRRPESRSPVMPSADDLVAETERHLVSLETAIRHYKPQPYDGCIALMRTRQGRLMSFGRRYLGWVSVTEQVPRLIDVPGPHTSMLDEPHVQVVAKKLVDWLCEGESTC